jgi:hypothetical protein
MNEQCMELPVESWELWRVCDKISTQFKSAVYASIHVKGAEVVWQEVGWKSEATYHL